MKAAVLGATGYTGQLLVRLLAGHPEISRILPVSSSRPGQTLEAVDPGMGGAGGKLAHGGRLLALQQAVEAEPQVVFSALPHLESAGLCAPFSAKRWSSICRRTSGCGIRGFSSGPTGSLRPGPTCWSGRRMD